MAHTIDVDSIFSEVQSGPTENMSRWIKVLSTHAVAEMMSNYLANKSAQYLMSGDLLGAASLASSAVVVAIQISMTVAFEAGRLYGRTEITNELMPKEEE